MKASKMCIILAVENLSWEWNLISNFDTLDILAENPKSGKDYNFFQFSSGFATSKLNQKIVRKQYISKLNNINEYFEWIIQQKMIRRAIVIKY